MGTGDWVSPLLCCWPHDKPLLSELALSGLPIADSGFVRAVLSSSALLDTLTYIWPPSDLVWCGRLGASPLPDRTGRARWVREDSSGMACQASSYRLCIPSCRMQLFPLGSPQGAEPGGAQSLAALIYSCLWYIFPMCLREGSTLFQLKVPLCPFWVKHCQRQYLKKYEQLLWNLTVSC